MHILILGGTTEASALAALLADHPRFKATLSLAGRTKSPALPAIPCRIGGFGGVEGLTAWLREHRVTALIDATHPFAKQMPFHAEAAAGNARIPLLSLLRPAWTPDPADHWIDAADHREAVHALGENPRRVFLTVGRMELSEYAAAPQHHYVVRSVDPVEHPPLADAVYIASRGPFTLEGELALLDAHAIDTVITKNSGAEATRAKLDAARARGLPVIMLKRPPRPHGAAVETAAEALRWIEHLHAPSS